MSASQTAWGEDGTITLPRSICEEFDAMDRLTETSDRFMRSAYKLVEEAVEEKQEREKAAWETIYATYGLDPKGNYRVIGDQGTNTWTLVKVEEEEE